MQHARLGKRRRDDDAYTYQQDSVLGGEGEDVGAGDDPRARLLEVGLDGVDDLEPPGRVQVRPSQLLAVAPVQQDGPVATLQVQCAAKQVFFSDQHAVHI